WLAMLAILMHRYAKRIPQTRLFSENADPDPSRPLAVDSSVFEASRLHLFHSYGRPYYFGIDDLCDASSENAEQFLRLAAILVEAIATRLIRGRPASLRSDEQDRLLRERAASFIKDWNFPQFDHVRTLVDLIAKQCLAVSLEPNAWIGAGANAFGTSVLQPEFGMKVPWKWERCIVQHDAYVLEFIKDFFGQNNRTVLLIAGAGFDPRATNICELLSATLEKRLRALLLREERPN